MAIPGTVTFTAVAAPTSTGDTYPVIDPKYGIDGLRNVLTNVERNAIPNDRRKQGMIVGVNATGTTTTNYWTLLPSPWTGTDADWSVFNAGGSGTTSGDTYVTGWQIERQLGNTVNIGKGLGKILFTSGSSIVTATNGCDFSITTNFDSPAYYYQATVMLSDGTIRYISFTNFTGSTTGEFYDIMDGSNTSLGGVWDKPTGEYEYYSYFIPYPTGEISYAEGYQTKATNIASHAEGNNTTASGSYSHAEGILTTASGEASHAEGNTTTASGIASHAEGASTSAIGTFSHAEGGGTIASGNYSHAGGEYSVASGNASFVHGSDSIASGTNTIVLGAGITGTSNNTVYVPYLNIGLLSSGTSVNNLGIDAYGNVVSGATASAQTTGIKYNILSGETVDIAADYEYFVYGNLTLEGTINNSGKIVIMNGAFINSGGTYNQLSGGSLTLVSSQSINKYSITTGLTANTPLVITHNLGTPDVMITVKDLNTGYKIGVDEYNYNLNDVTVESTNTLTNIRITIVG